MTCKVPAEKTIWLEVILPKRLLDWLFYADEVKKYAR